ncbi:PQQ-dependent sugar dehydrogenase [Streptomyces sp. NPDC059853]|uniref:PQQ-dependent sugar dehydrogenase n=1 Tax=Streptomyces sp. NPDC059853 TaxID=3346973 RepID=UPI003654F524
MRRALAAAAALAALTTACAGGPAADRAAQLGAAPGAAPGEEPTGPDGTPSAPPPAQEPGDTPADPVVIAPEHGTVAIAETVAEDLPAGLRRAAALPDGTLLLTPATGGTVHHLDPATGDLTVAGEVESTTGEPTIVDIAASDEAVYIAYEGAQSNRISRYTYDAGTLRPTGSAAARDLPRGAGLMAFGPDGLLYTSTGPAGEILRIDPARPAATAAISTGHTDLRGLAWDPMGQLWTIDPGNGATTDVLPITPENPLPPADTTVPATENPTDLTQIAGSLWMTTESGTLWRYPLPNASPEPFLTDDLGPLTAVLPTPDGEDLWLLTETSLLRLTVT